MEFHLDPADPCKIVRIYMPFGTFAIAFQEITAPCHPDECPKGVGRYGDLTIVPIDFLGPPVTKCTLNDTDGNSIQPDIFPQKVCSDRFYGDHMRRIPRGPDTECTYVRTDIDNPFVGTDIIEPVFRYVMDLAVRCITQDESDIARRNKIREIIRCITT